MTVGLRPNAYGPGDPGSIPRLAPRAEPGTPELAAPQSTRSADRPLTAKPVGAPAGSANASAIAGKWLTTELIVPQPAKADDDSATPEPALAVPAGPLKTYAQIPTEMMQEISRLREEAAEASARGVPGRNDPTPMPASPDAIGSSEVPYDAA